MTIEEILQDTINKLDNMNVSQLDEETQYHIKGQVDHMRHILTGLPQYILDMECLTCTNKKESNV